MNSDLVVIGPQNDGMDQVYTVILVMHVENEYIMVDYIQTLTFFLVDWSSLAALLTCFSLKWGSGERWDSGTVHITKVL